MIVRNHHIDGRKYMQGPVGSFRDSASAMAFLVGELEKRDPKLLRPLSTTFWPDFVPVAYGGGPVDYVTSIYEDYGSTGRGSEALGRASVTEVAKVNATLKTKQWPTVMYMADIDINYLDRANMLTAGRNLDEILTRGLHEHFDTEVDNHVFLGLEEINTYGLVNNPEIPASLAPVGAEGETTWESKTSNEILADISALINQVRRQTNYSKEGQPNRILMPSRAYEKLSLPLGGDGEISVLTFLDQNNVVSRRGVELEIMECRWCEGAGTGGTDRIIAYAAHPNIVEFDITIPLRRTGGIEQKTRMHTIGYEAQYSQVKFKRPEAFAYMDGI